MKNTVTFYVGTYFDFFENMNNYFRTVHIEEVPANAKSLQSIEAGTYGEATIAAKKILRKENKKSKWMVCVIF